MGGNEPEGDLWLEQSRAKSRSSTNSEELTAADDPMENKTESSTKTRSRGQISVTAEQEEVDHKPRATSTTKATVRSRVQGRKKAISSAARASLGDVKKELLPVDSPIDSNSEASWRAYGHGRSRLEENREGIEKSKLGATSAATTTARSKSRGRDRAERIRQLMERARARDRGTPDDRGRSHSPNHTRANTESLSRHRWDESGPTSDSRAVVPFKETKSELSHRRDESDPTSDSRAMVPFKETKSELSHSQHLKYGRKNSDGSHATNGRSSSRSLIEGRSSSRSRSRSDRDRPSRRHYERRSSSSRAYATEGEGDRNSIGKRDSRGGDHRYESRGNRDDRDRGWDEDFPFQRVRSRSRSRRASTLKNTKDKDTSMTTVPTVPSPYLSSSRSQQRLHR